MFRNREGLKHLMVGFALAVGTVLLYLPVRNHEFIWLDDPDYVTENAYIRMGLTWESISWAFTHTFSSNWHPLTWISHMLDWQMFGSSAGGHHLVNVTFHVANSVILFLFLRSITGAFWRAAVVAALFAWHPTHVESVAWVSERKDVLSTFFGLLTLWAYGAYARRTEVRIQMPERGHLTSDVCPPSSEFRAAPSALHFLSSGHYWLALGLFALGLMSKPMLVTWPFVMLLLDIWPLERWQPSAIHIRRLLRLLVEKIPFLALVIISCVVTVLAQDKWRSMAKGSDFPISYRFSNAFVSYLRYLGKLFWPSDLAAFYPFPESNQWELASIAVIVLIVISVAVLWRAKSQPSLLIGWLWYVGTLVPVIGLVQVGGQSMADRYTYIPSIGLFLAVVWLTADIMKRMRSGTSLLPWAAAIALLACVIVSARQIETWKNSRTVFEQAAKATKRNFLALNSLGEIARREGNVEQALKYSQEAVQYGRMYPGAWSGLGMALYANGQKEEAIRALREAVRLNPDDPQALDHLGFVLLAENQPAEAEPVLRHALEVRPGFAEAQTRLGETLEQLGRTDEALENYATALKYKPDAANLRTIFASALARQRRFDDAIREYRTVLTLQPHHTGALQSLAALLMESGSPVEAAAHFEKVTTLEPRNALAFDGLGLALAMSGEKDRAAAAVARAVEIAPSNATIRLHFGMTLQNQNRAAEAAKQYRAAISADPNQTAALNNLAWLLATSPDDSLRNGTEAVEFAKRATDLTENREPILIGTLAAAYAEAGRFPEAIATAEKARDLAKSAGLEKIVQRNTELLELYRAGKPFREQPSGGAIDTNP